MSAYNLLVNFKNEAINHGINGPTNYGVYCTNIYKGGGDVE